MQPSSLIKFVVAAAAATVAFAAPSPQPEPLKEEVKLTDAQKESKLRAYGYGYNNYGNHNNYDSYCSSNQFHCAFLRGDVSCTNFLREVNNGRGRFLIYARDQDAECYGSRGGSVSINFRSDNTYIQVQDEGITAALSNRRFDVISRQGQYSYSGQAGSDVYVNDGYNYQAQA